GDRPPAAGAGAAGRRGAGARRTRALALRRPGAGIGLGRAQGADAAFRRAAGRGQGPAARAAPGTGAALRATGGRRGSILPARPCRFAPMSGAAPRPFSLSTAAEPTVFQQLLGAPFFNLPPSLRRLHSIRGQDAFAGEVDIERGRGLLARLCGRLAGMPPAMQAAPLRVEFSADPRSETWRR